MTGFLIALLSGALELTQEIVQDVYQKTNDVRLREFILNNQKQSGEGSV